MASGLLQHEFGKKYKAEIRKYGMMQRYDDSLQYLQEHPYLVCEETANYLVIWCIDLEAEEVSQQLVHQDAWEHSHRKSN